MTRVVTMNTALITDKKMVNEFCYFLGNGVESFE